jgi:hypothetical protein
MGQVSDVALAALLALLIARFCPITLDGALDLRLLAFNRRRRQVIGLLQEFSAVLASFAQVNFLTLHPAQASDNVNLLT